MPDTFELRDPVTPYVCSTPTDFLEERDFIRENVFPKLDDLCKSRGSYFNPVDFIWKPADANSRSGMLLKTQLDAIKKCSPFFIGILGETYGPHRDPKSPRLVKPRNGRRFLEGNDVDWLDKNFLMAAHSGHTWVLEDAHQASSISELEVTQANFLSDNEHATLYYRQLEHLEDKLELIEDQSKDNAANEGVVSDDLNKLRQSIIQRHSSESEYAKTKVRDLKQRLVNRGIPVKYFRTLEELGQHLMEDWCEIIDMLLPPLIHDAGLLNTLQYKEWIAQQSFMTSRTQICVSTNEVEELLQDISDFALTCTKVDANFDAENNIFPIFSNHKRDENVFSLTAWLKNRPSHSKSTVPSIFLLGGDRGVGKSTIISRWVKDFKAEYPHIFVKEHFVSSSAYSANLCSLMHECIKDLRKHFLLSDNYHSNKLCVEMEREAMSNFLSFSALCQAFLAAMSLGPCVIVIDGLNELTSCLGLTIQEVKEFDWLPQMIPSCCKLILTTTRSDISHRSLSDRGDVVVINCPSSLTEASTNIGLVKEYAPDASKLLGGDEKVRSLGSLRVMQSTLGSKVISNEIGRPYVYQNFPVFMEQWTEIWSLRNFWTLCVQNWVQNYSWISDSTSSEIQFFDNGFDYSGWVADSLCLIALSRNGLTQYQVLSILKTIGYEGELEVMEYQWHQFLLSARATLHTNADGRIVFSHSYLHEVAGYLFFKSMSSVTHDPVILQKSSKEGLRQAYHTHLARFFTQQPLTVQSIGELPWHLMLSGNILGLVDFLTDSGVLLKMLDGPDSETWLQDLKLFWSVCCLNGHVVDQIYISMVHSMGIVETQDLQKFEEYPEREIMWSPSPRIVISTPQPTNDVFDRNGKPDDMKEEETEKKEIEEEEVPFQSEQEGGVDLDCSFTDGIFVTQSGQTHSASMSRNMSNKLSSQDHFPSMTILCWHLAQLMSILGHNKAHRCLLSSLVKYMQRNYPLSLTQHLTLSRCHHKLGAVMESSGQTEMAETEYRLALQSVMTADDMDDDMLHQTDILYLKATLLCCYGNCVLAKGNLFESEELLKEALECIEDNTDCFVLRSNIHQSLGHLRTFQHDFPRAEACLRQSVRLRSQWVGSSHPMVADVFVELARILISSANNKSFDASQAENLYREALRIREQTVGPNDLSIATVLFELGVLLAAEENQLVKMEAQRLLRRSLDIGTTELGTTHPQTAIIQQSLTHLDVALKLGHYEFGPARPKGARSRNAPFSAMTFRDGDLSRLKNRIPNNASSLSYQDPMIVKSVSREEVIRHNRPDSIGSMGSERLFSAPGGEWSHNRLLSREKDKHGFDSSRSSQLKGYENDSKENRHDSARDLLIVDSLDSKGRRVITGENDDENSTDVNDNGLGDRLGNGTDRNTSGDEHVKDNYIDSSADLSPSKKNVKGKKRVHMRPSSAPRRMFQRFQNTDVKVCIQPPSNAGRKSITSTQRSRSQVWSGRSNASSNATNSHMSRCSVPGRHDIPHSTSRTISGPHTSLSSLLGDPPCPRPPSSNVHHRSAWYHIPGRYTTTQAKYPSKRIQKTDNAKDIESFLYLKMQWEKKKMFEQQLSIQRLNSNQHPQSDNEAVAERLDKQYYNTDQIHNLGQSPSKLKSQSTSSSKKAAHRNKCHLNKSETPRLMISGLDKVPEPRYNQDNFNSLNRSHGHGVKFKEPIIVG